MCPVFMIRRTPGSTSRIDIGTVQLSHAWIPGDLTRPTIVAACAPRPSGEAGGQPLRFERRSRHPRERTVIRWNPAGVDPLPAGRVVYTDMCADLFHAGHVNFLRQAKALGDRLVVGVHDDRTIASYKTAPIQTLAERVAVVAACRYVDQVVPHAPLEVSPRYLDQLDVQVVCHADDLTAAARERMYGEILATREFAWIPYTPGISTRALRERVLEADRQSSGGADASGGSRQ